MDAEPAHTRLEWHDDPAWRAICGSSERGVSIDSALWKAAPPQLGPEATSRYRALAEEPVYLSWWADACGGDAPGARRFALSVPADHWERPWESTIAALRASRWQDVAMSRLLAGQRAPAAPQEIGKPLRVLVLQGQQSGPGLDGLDLESELQALIKARNSLDAAVLAQVSPIEARPARRSELVDVLIETKPSILWLSGHATNEPPGFLLADGSWLTPDELAATIVEASKSSETVPLYVAMWACRTGQRERFVAPGAAPPFVRALAGAGVSAVLATLGPLADDIAPEFAASVLGAVAVGRPLDHAVAHGRAGLMMTQLDQGNRDDWACPVVWCVDLPDGEITWSEAAASAQRQNLARRLLPAGVNPSEPSLNGTAQAQTWSEQKRVWVTNRTPGAFQVRAEWFGRIIEQQRLSRQMVVALDFRDATPNNVLREWASRVLKTTDGFDDPDRHLRELAVAIREDTVSGWQQLCADATITLALFEPSDQEAWLWDALANAPCSAVVLSGSSLPPQAAAIWKADMLEFASPADPATVPPGGLAPAFAVLAFPAAKGDLTQLDAEQAQALSAAGLVVDTRAGCLMPLSAADRLARKLDNAQITEAHRTAFKLLDGTAARTQVNEGSNEALLRARLHHALGGGEPEALAISAQQLMAYYRGHRRASALLDVLAHVNPRDIDENWKVSAGWAHLVLGRPDRARDYLDNARDDELDPVRAADKHQLLAEVEKSSGRPGSKQRARDQLDQALAALTDDTSQDAAQTRLRIRHDLARLTHFIEHDPAAAIPVYQAVIQDWQAVPNSGLDQAIALRNLAEARMAVAEAQTPTDQGMLNAADDDLAAARDRLPAHTGHIVAAELEYLAGRLAIRRGEETQATRSFERARAVALATNQMMLAAIAEARLFWRHVGPQELDAYDPGGWVQTAKALIPFERHGWAARVLIDGHLRSARKLVHAGLNRASRGPLLAAKTLLDANPAFDRGSDRDRIVATYAGLVVAEQDLTAWQQLSTRFQWFAEWTNVKNAGTPETAWEATR